MSRYSLMVLLLLSQLAIAQTPPFVKFNDRDSEYLRRIHRPDRAPLNSDKVSPGRWTRWQRQARSKLEELLGLAQIAEDCRGHQVTVGMSVSKKENGFTRQLHVIETEPGIQIPFWVLKPDDYQVSPRPLAICAQGHGGNSWNNYAGIFHSEDEKEKADARKATPGLEAVKRGYVTIVPAVRGLATVASIADPKGRHGDQPCRAQLVHCLLAGRTAIGERGWDCQRILDWAFATLENIDRRRILFTGNSGGGVLTVYMAALDRRITVAAPSCSFTSYTSSTGFVFHCDCCLIPRVQSELGDLSDIGALIAPRYLIAVHGKQDSLHHLPDVENAMQRVQKVYQKTGVAGHFSYRWGDAGHKFYPELMWPWIERSFEEIQK